MTEKIEDPKGSAPQRATKKTKSVRNRSGHRVELVNNNEVVVFIPGKVVEVPIDFDIPSGLGLYVR